MTNAQLAALVIPIVLAQVSTIVVLIFGFISNNKRLDDIRSDIREVQAELKKLSERVTRLEERTPPLLHR
jgi:outer membrane murein-binding lipoprotein Lpp